MANDKEFLVCEGDKDSRGSIYGSFDGFYDPFDGVGDNYKLYHYTNLKVLDALLANCTFWASHIRYLNDSKECEAGAEIDASGSNYAGLFTVSFSQESDSLHQWITYAKESGVAVELDYELICRNEPGKEDWYCIDSIKKKKEGEGIKYSEQIGIKLQSLIYEVNYNNRADIDIKGKDYNTFRKLWQAAYKKSDSYIGEKEVRLAVFATIKRNDGNETKSKINYFCLPEKNILRPYLELTFGYNTGIGKNRIFKPCLPIKSITVGPSGIQQTVFDSVVHRIKFGECNIYNYCAKDKTQFVKNFINYLYEVYCNCNLKSKYLDSAIKLADVWSYDSGKELRENIIDAMNYLIVKGKELADFIKWVKYENDIAQALICSWMRENMDENTSIVEKEKVSMIKEINQNFYFSKEGILIRKSKIPYIF